MPVKKPVGLHTRHATKAEKQARVAAEESLAPEHGLPMAAPARLKGHPAAGEVWRRLIRLYGELDATIVNRLDQDLLIDYCMLMEQLGELDLMRRTAYQAWLDLGVAVERAKTRAKEAEQAALAAVKASQEETAADQLAQLSHWQERAVDLAVKCLDAFDAVIKLDARADQKRKALHQWRQSLYLTPRARAGAAPARKEQEEPVDPMEQFLGEVADYVNSGAGHEQ